MATLRADLTLLAALSVVMIVGCGEGMAPDVATSESAPGDMAYSREMAAAPLTLESSAGTMSELGEGPGQGGDQYDLIVENAFVAAQHATRLHLLD